MAGPSHYRADAEDAGGRSRFPRAIWIGRARLTAVELLAIAGGLVVFGDVGWDGALWDGRLELILHLIGGIALLAGLVALLRGRRYPRSGLEIPILAFLVALGLATLVGQNHGLAARAMAATVAFACLLPLAILAVTRRPVLAALVTLVPTLVLAATILWQLVARRIGWFSLGLGGLPPVRLPSESTAFGSVEKPKVVTMAMSAATVKAPPKLPQNTSPQFFRTPCKVTPGRRSSRARGVSTNTPVSRSNPSR